MKIKGILPSGNEYTQEESAPKLPVFDDKF